MPIAVSTYSSGLGTLKPRWVRRRWYVRQMPTEADSQYRNTKMPSADQENITGARSAPRWIAPK
jgi:hypothetical protein